MANSIERTSSLLLNGSAKDLFHACFLIAVHGDDLRYANDFSTYEGIVPRLRTEEQWIRFSEELMQAGLIEESDRKVLLEARLNLGGLSKEKKGETSGNPQLQGASYSDLEDVLFRRNPVPEFQQAHNILMEGKDLIYRTRAQLMAIRMERQPEIHRLHLFNALSDLQTAIREASATSLMIQEKALPDDHQEAARYWIEKSIQGSMRAPPNLATRDVRAMKDRISKSLRMDFPPQKFQQKFAYLINTTNERLKKQTGLLYYPSHEQPEFRDVVGHGIFFVKLLTKQNDGPVDALVVPKVAVPFDVLARIDLEMLCLKQMVLSTHFPKFLGLYDAAPAQLPANSRVYAYEHLGVCLSLQEVCTRSTSELDTKSNLFHYWKRNILDAMVDLRRMSTNRISSPLQLSNFFVCNHGLRIVIRDIPWDEALVDTSEPEEDFLSDQHAIHSLIQIVLGMIGLHPTDRRVQRLEPSIYYLAEKIQQQRIAELPTIESLLYHGDWLLPEVDVGALINEFESFVLQRGNGRFVAA